MMPSMARMDSSRSSLTSRSRTSSMVKTVVPMLLANTSHQPAATFLHGHGGRSNTQWSQGKEGEKGREKSNLVTVGKVTDSLTGL